MAGLGTASVLIIALAFALAVGPAPGAPLGPAPGAPLPAASLPAAPPPPALPPAAVAPPAVAPVRATALAVPDLGVRADLVDLGIDPAGGLEVPVDAAVPGWFTGGAVPGELGPTVIAGHVDSRSGPGVFHRLADLPLGAQVDVARSDGGIARYRVVGVATVLKSAFPTELVYGPTSGAELRLITCGGEFDRGTGHYVRNVVVSAVLVDPT